MPDAQLATEVLEVSLHLIDADRAGRIDGSDVAAELGRNDIEEIDLYYAFQEIQRRALLRMYFPGGMGLPVMVQRP